MTKPALSVIERAFSIHRFPPDASIPEELERSPFFWVGRTDEELSVVCDAELDPPSEHRSDGWSCLKVVGPIDFSVTGLLADISGALAIGGIPVFVVSTFETDYILVREEHLAEAIRRLAEHGYAGVSG